LSTEAIVVQAYYQLVADLALVEAARKQLELLRVNARVAEESLRAGTATTLDVERARAEVERQSQQLSLADLAAKLAARTLESQTGLPADLGSAPVLTDNLHAERPLAEFAAAGGSVPAVRAAVSARDAAERSATAQKLTLVPTLQGTVIQRFTNATGF